MTVISAFTIVRNAVALDYPIVPAIRSVLGICDEFVVNVGKSEDGTREQVAGIGDPRIRILDTVWDLSRAGLTLAAETDRAMRACRGAWGVYIQADEVLHETGATILKDRIAEWDGDPRVEGLLVDYLHFYGDFDTLATNRHWYRREVRAVRLGAGLHAYGDAQGFRGALERRVRARATGAAMFHYGWARHPAALEKKHAAFQGLFQEDEGKIAERRAQPRLQWTPGLRRFTGTHPKAAQEWIAVRRGQTAEPAVEPRGLKLGDVRFYLSDWIERLTGARLFEYRNYVLV